MHVNADSLLIRAATTSTSGTDLIMANYNNSVGTKKLKKRRRLPKLACTETPQRLLKNCCRR